MCASKSTCRLPPLVLIALLAACGAESADGEPTFANDVAPIVYRSCTPCHHPDGPTPFSLLGYDDVRKRRRQIMRVVEDRIMPPWLPSHGEFLDSRRLAEDEIDVLRRWVAAGMPRGEAADEPPCPEFTSDWQLREPDLVLSLDEQVTVPADGPDQFRNYVIPIPVDRVRFVEAMEIRPGSPAVHHAVVAIDATGESRRRDALDPEPGFAGMSEGNAQAPDGYFLGWTPGKHVRRTPEGMAWRLIPGRDLVLQLHLTPTGKVETVVPRLGLYFTDRAPTVVSYPLVLFNDDIDLAPGETGHMLRDHFVLPVDVEVFSIYPHAHYLCRRMRGTATLPDGSSKDLFRIDRWDFDWQDDYRYREPIPLPAGTRIAFEYEFDNSADNPQNPFQPPRRVAFGQESTDEMATLTLQLTTADLDARRELAAASLRRDIEKVGAQAGLLLQLTGVLRELGRFEEAFGVCDRVRQAEPGNAMAWFEFGRCLIGLRRLEDAERALRESLRLDPSHDMSRIELGSVLARSGRTKAAIGLFEQALKTSPGFSELHNNLATAYYSEGRLRDAERHYRRALQIDETYFNSWFLLGQVLLDQKRKPEARDALLRAQKLRPGFPPLEQALQQLGQ
ncbi:MAG: tetratricopeptide repeat protein [bacterium]|nr:tetratricopeptide repeat protein [bacterium]